MKASSPGRDSRAPRARFALGGLLLAAGSASAQLPVPDPTLVPPPGQPWRIIPSITLGETYSDNTALAADPIAQRGWITDLSPGLRVERQGARLRVFGDFRLHRVTYSNDSTLNDTTRYVDAIATFEPVEKWLFIDGRASITQQNRSPFAGAVLPDAPSANANRVETTVYQVAPYVRGHLGGLADYQLRYNETSLSADESGLPHTRTSDVVGRVRNPSPSAKVGWTVDVRDLRIRNDTVGNQSDSRASAGLIFGLNPQLQLSVNAGRERTDFNGGVSENSDTFGGGIAWAPSTRTQVAGVYERRFFGDAHDLSVNHRTASTAWHAASRRDATTFATQLTSGNTGTVQSLLADLLVATIPDPVQRQVEARRRLEETGVPTSSSLSNGFLTERPYLLRTDEASAAYRGIRDTFTVSILRTERRSLGGNFTPIAGLPTTDDVREQTVSANWVHRLTPLSSITLSAAARRTEGISTPEESRQQLYSLLFTSRLGPRTYASFGLRHTQFESNLLADYHENAVVATFSYRP